MREDRRALRQRQIEEASYAVLERAGYEGASMLAIAREAKASNETLYNWYGDKKGLFRALVERNADDVAETLAADPPEPRRALPVLAEAGTRLLMMLMSDRAVALNRTAAAERTGELGRILAELGRGRVAPRIAGLLDQARAAGSIAFDDSAAAAELFLALLVGDLQIRRVVHRLPAPDEAACRRRAELAVQRITQLLAPLPAGS